MLYCETLDSTNILVYSSGTNSKELEIIIVEYKLYQELIADG